MKPIRCIINRSGASCLLVEAECHVSNGLPSISIIGYASKAVDEAKDRIRASFSSSSILLPRKKITINLAPADVPKDSTSLDLAIAVSILTASAQVDAAIVDHAIFLGELGLDGSLRPVRGLIGRLLEAKRIGAEVIYLPAANLSQANLVAGLRIKAAQSLKDVFMDLSRTLPLKTTVTSGTYEHQEDTSDYIDMSEIAGQPIAKRAMEIAAAGHHNILLHGPPGTGKTMLARAMCGILPPLDHEEVLEVTHLHSLGSLDASEVITKRPFRAPHHTASTTAIIGGGTSPKPGEASLAHAGVLFLDELPEFTRSCLESLRQPLEDGKVTISRVKESVAYPASFILVATQNPCPCGYLGTSRACTCSAADISRYQRKVSGPILDRIDLHLQVAGVDHKSLLETGVGSDESPRIRQRVADTYQKQRRRFNAIRFNSQMSNKEIKSQANLSTKAKEFLDEAARKLDISARSYVRTVRVARTIADLDSSSDINTEHISEALQYRQPMRRL